MHQCELVVGLLFQEPNDGKWIWITLPVNHPLQCSDTGTGETYFAMWSEAAQFGLGPSWAALRQMFPFRVQAKTLDRAGSNIRAVRKCAAATTPALGDVHILTSCDAHVVGTSCGRMLSPVTGMMTGLISLSLAMRFGGQFMSFRRVLTKVILQSLTVVKSSPLEPEHSQTRYRDTLLNLCLPASCPQIAKLRTLLTGDLLDNEILWRRPQGAASKHECKAYAQDLAANLLPNRLVIFSRTRWMQSVTPIAEAALLANTHNLLPRAVMAWTSKTKGVDECKKSEFDPRWDAISSDGEKEGEDVAEEPPKAAGDIEGDAGAPAATGNIDWAAYNKEQQKGSRKFAALRPAGVLVSTVIVAQPMVALQQRVEDLDSDDWEVNQLHKAAVSGKPIKTRMCSVAALEMTDAYYRDVDALLGAHPKWSLLQQDHRTVQHSNRVLSMLALGMCSIALLMEWVHSSYPLKLFALIRNPGKAVEILNDCMHTMDAFTKAFLAMFPGSKLASKKARMYLLAVGALLRKSTQRIECRHAAIRRRIGNRYQRVHEDFAETSAYFFLMRQRVLEHAFKVGASAKAKTEQRRKTIQTGKLKGKYTGGGGERRAAMSELWSTLNAGGNLPSPERRAKFSQAHRIADAAPPEDRARWAEIGKAGTASHSAGAPSFGQRKRPCPSEKAETAARRIRGRTSSNALAVAVSSRSSNSSDDVVVVEDLEATVQPPPPSETLALALAMQNNQIQSWRAEVAAAACKMAEKREQQRLTTTELVQWVNQNTDVQAHGIAGGPDLAKDGALVLPMGGTPFDVTWITWTPPAKTMASSVLSGNRKSMARQLNVRQLLIAEWQKLHWGWRHDKLPPLQEPGPEQPHVCICARFCVCEPKYDRCKRWVSILRQYLSCRGVAANVWLAKKTLPRKVFNNGRMVLRAYRSAGFVTAPSSADLWFYVPFGNLNSRLYSGVTLDYTPTSMSTCKFAQLSWPFGSRPVTMWQAMLNASLSFQDGDTWEVALWQLSQATNPVLRFEPGRRIAVTLVQPTFLFVLETSAPAAGDVGPDQGRAHPLPIVPYVDPGGSREDACADIPAPDGGPCGGDVAADPNAILAVEDGDPDCDSNDGDDSGAAFAGRLCHTATLIRELRIRPFSG
jgi:hypothetical protein